MYVKWSHAVSISITRSIFYVILCWVDLLKGIILESWTQYSNNNISIDLIVWKQFPPYL